MLEYDEDGDRVLVIDDRSKETVDIFVYDETIGNPTTYRGKSVTWSHGREIRKNAQNDIIALLDNDGNI